MSAVSSLPLLFKAHVLGSTSAKVALAIGNHSGSRLVDAFSAVRNRENALTKQYWTGRISPCQFQISAARLTESRNRLLETNGPWNKGETFDGLLSRVSNRQPFNASSSAVDALHAMMSPMHRVVRGKEALVTAFWAGELNDFATFHREVDQLASYQAQCSPPTWLAYQPILNLLAMHTPADSNFNVQAKVLKTFTEKLRGMSQ
jgi:hypothetical protein